MSLHREGIAVDFMTITCDDVLARLTSLADPARVSDLASVGVRSAKILGLSMPEIVDGTVLNLFIKTPFAHGKAVAWTPPSASTGRRAGRPKPPMPSAN